MARSRADGPTDRRAGKAGGWRSWLAVVIGAAILLALSQTLWFWQTWPVRALLQLPAAAGPLQ